MSSYPRSLGYYASGSVTQAMLAMAPSQGGEPQVFTNIPTGSVPPLPWFRQGRILLLYLL